MNRLRTCRFFFLPGQLIYPNTSICQTNSAVVSRLLRAVREGNLQRVLAAIANKADPILAYGVNGASDIFCVQPGVAFGLGLSVGLYQIPPLWRFIRHNNRQELQTRNAKSRKCHMYGSKFLPWGCFEDGIDISIANR